MGWCSATEIFDPVVEKVLSLVISEDDKVEVLVVLIDKLQNADWDCEQDSDFWNHPTVRKAFKKTNPDWDWKEIEEER